MLDISSFWLFFDILSILLILINIYFVFKRKRRIILYLVCFSIASECLALLSSFQQVVTKVTNNNVSYILDVVPSLNNFRTPIVLNILVVNLIIIFFTLVFKIKK